MTSSRHQTHCCVYGLLTGELEILSYKVMVESRSGDFQRHAYRIQTPEKHYQQSIIIQKTTKPNTNFTEIQRQQLQRLETQVNVDT